MFTAEQLRKQNIAEYLLYMWQIEDLIRANDCDIEKIKATVIPSYGLDEAGAASVANWFADFKMFLFVFLVFSSFFFAVHFNIIKIVVVNKTINFFNKCISENDFVEERYITIHIILIESLLVVNFEFYLEICSDKFVILIIVIDKEINVLGYDIKLIFIRILFNIKSVKF